MTAAEALRKARVTMDCGGAGLLTGCAFQYVGPLTSDTVLGMEIRLWSVADAHRWEASAILDGFSVAEVTAAELELAR